MRFLGWDIPFSHSENYLWHNELKHHIKSNTCPIIVGSNKWDSATYWAKVSEVL